MLRSERPLKFGSTGQTERGGGDSLVRLPAFSHSAILTVFPWEEEQYPLVISLVTVKSPPRLWGDRFAIAIPCIQYKSGFISLTFPVRPLAVTFSRLVSHLCEHLATLDGEGGGREGGIQRRVCSGAGLLCETHLLPAQVLFRQRGLEHFVVDPLHLDKK